MSIDERRRHGLYQELEATIGRDHADTLMSMLPPTGWADVATKSDLASLERVLSAKIETVEHRLNASFQEALRHQLWATVGVMLVTVLASIWLGR
jgi:hypothetical protein